MSFKNEEIPLTERGRQIQECLEERILFMDGAMGTMIQKHCLEEPDFRGERFKSWNSDLKGNNDLLSLTRPDLIKQIHLDFLMAGADIIETNTFNSTSISQSDYGMESVVNELNRESAGLAKKVVTDFTRRHPEKTCFVA
ncbi:MAG TPA: methionine synthase, partial [Verrucomicrobia bacterium]|nr:methionine synthase [Verrucomicrobiota bacterium]